MPPAVKSLPDHAQDIFLKAFNNAFEEYKDEKKAFAVAWAAVGEKYQKGADGKWHPKKERSVDDDILERADGGPGDYLVVEDPKKPSTWHLRVKVNGKPDRRLMGAAWAALHGGYRGQKYQGPKKDEALAKLKALYKSEGVPTPDERSGETVEQAAMPMLVRGAASFVPTTINEAARTVDVVWSTGADVKRQGFFGPPFVERLDMADEAVDLSRLNSGANVLDSHQANGGIRNILGVVEPGTAEIKGPKGQRKGRATIRFSSRADVEPVWTDVKAGIIRNVSVGYSVQSWERIEPRVTDGPDALPVMIAKRWQPAELSLVAVPADAGAHVRSGGEEFPCVIRSEPDQGDDLWPELDPTPATDEEQEPMALAASRTAEKAVEEPRAEEKDLPGLKTPQPPLDINERPADPHTSENEGPAPQVEPGTAPAQDPKTGVVQQPQQPAAPRQPEAQPPAEGGERRAPVEATRPAGGSDQRGLSQEDCAAIFRAASSLALPAEFAVGLVERAGMTLDQARQLIIDEAAKRQEPSKVRNVTVTSVRDEAETRARSIAAALLHKRYPEAARLEGPEGELARQWMGMPLMHIARVELEKAGYRDAWTMSPGEAAHRALLPGYGVRQGGYTGVRTGSAGLNVRDGGGYLSTSDFASVLIDVMHKSARAAYDLLQPTYLPLVRRATHRDYRLYNSIQLSNLGTLSRVREHGEYVSTAISDSKEAYAVAKYGARIAFTREALINDDLGMLTDVPGKFGVAARNTESDIVWSIILANAAMADSVALFHSSHGNLASSTGAPGITTVGTAFSDMAVQKDPDGKTFLNVQPKYIVAPPVLWAVIAQLTGQITPNQITSLVPPAMGALVPIVEPRLQGGVTVDGTTYSGSTTAWYLVADPAQLTSIEIAYLEGGDGLYTETRQGFEIDGLEVKVRLDFGAKAIDFRGLYKNAG